MKQYGTRAQKKNSLKALEESKEVKSDVPSDASLKTSLKTGINEFTLMKVLYIPIYSTYFEY